MDYLYFICWKIWSKNRRKYFWFCNVYFLRGLSFAKLCLHLIFK